MNNNTLRILMLEDSPTDRELIERELIEDKLNFISKMVDCQQDFIDELDNFKPDLILADYSLPNGKIKADCKKEGVTFIITFPII